jgi:hypothetical protein
MKDNLNQRTTYSYQLLINSKHSIFMEKVLEMKEVRACVEIAYDKN